MGTTNSDIFVRPRIESNDGDGERQRLEQREGARNNRRERTQLPAFAPAMGSFLGQL